MRDAYRALLTEGYSGPKATAQLLRDWKETLADEDDAPIFWLALAATQWQCGRLEARVKAKALRIIDQGSSLALWSEGDPKTLKRRQAALEKLRRQLHSPQPSPKKFRKRRESTGDWRVGEVLAYRLRSGRLILLVHRGLEHDLCSLFKREILEPFQSIANANWSWQSKRPTRPVRRPARACNTCNNRCAGRSVRWRR